MPAPLGRPQVTTPPRAPGSTSDPAPARPPASSVAPATSSVLLDGFGAAAGPPRVELSKDRPVTAADLAALRAAGHGELAATVANAQRSYQALTDAGARLVIAPSAGNNGKPVITVVPPALAQRTDPAARYDVHVHFHGMHGTASKPSPHSPFARGMLESFSRAPPTVFVLPTAPERLSGGVSTPDWSNVRDTGKLARDAQSGLVGQRGTLTVSACHHRPDRDPLPPRTSETRVIHVEVAVVRA